MTKAANLAALGSVVEVPTGSAPSFQCRAWVSFNGQGTVAIRASGNVSSITDNGSGDFTVNFATAMPDANYAATFGGGRVSTSAVIMTERHNGNIRSTTQLRIYTLDQSYSVIDPEFVSVSFLR